MDVEQESKKYTRELQELVIYIIASEQECQTSFQKDALSRRRKQNANHKYTFPLNPPSMKKEERKFGAQNRKRQPRERENKTQKSTLMYQNQATVLMCLQVVRIVK